ncbi:hypothetical protein CHGG_00593 [Chaetomium globosum CBS 148.51]|uniref:Mitochondrial outer membrane transport complex Sam37/metaxin N-terminal domain-containing protein n=1 Tax=Chaetomium globosum (strain ATCC 6205 / CBS 148.51 / DSM 1962 / NBRC 6347 / NRRL 1970) TaxID=306901 RepID=Q2HGR1_CHAGB|nr:uncharacterized protein CHGG_00593 [Chaetomium globosum CBS 148.51]EAQ92358.1 hypothetical protein CHGG_00593 [Chaetomium globosum CBS 148.51]
MRTLVVQTATVFPPSYLPAMVLDEAAALFPFTLIDFVAPGPGSLSVEQQLASLGPPLHCAESFWLNSAQRSGPLKYCRVTPGESEVVGSGTLPWALLDPHVGGDAVFYQGRRASHGISGALYLARGKSILLPTGFFAYSSDAADENNAACRALDEGPHLPWRSIVTRSAAQDICQEFPYGTLEGCSAIDMAKARAAEPQLASAGRWLRGVEGPGFSAPSSAPGEKNSGHLTIPDGKTPKLLLAFGLSGPEFQRENVTKKGKSARSSSGGTFRDLRRNLYAQAGEKPHPGRCSVLSARSCGSRFAPYGEETEENPRIGTFTFTTTLRRAYLGFAERNTARPLSSKSPFSTGMSSITSPASSWRKMQIPRPLQQLFDHFPLQTYEPNHLPERSQHLTSSDLPTLYIFSTDADARLGLPSFNPGCLKWQTLLRLAKLDFRTLPSTNHASPTGSLPFLLPPRTSPTTAPLPIPASNLLAYAQRSQPGTGDLDPDLPPRSQAYLSLINLSLRSAWLYALYLDPSHAALLRQLYIRPASSSRGVQAALLYQLRRAAAEQIATTSAGGGKIVSLAPVASVEGIDEEAVYRSAREALEALASLLSQSETGWFFGRERPGVFDAALFSYTHLMMEYMPEEGGSAGEGTGVALGRMVLGAGDGELARHRERMLQTAWPGWDGYRK